MRGPTVIECGSGIEQVVVYARGAMVTRRVALPEALPEEAVELRVPGVTALADAGSVRALCDGEREVISLEARLVYPHAITPRGELAETIRELDLDRQRLEAEQRSLAALRSALTEVRLDPALSRWAKHLDPAARFADATALSGLVDGELSRIDGLLRGLADALVQNRRAREAAEVRAAQGRPVEVDGDRRARLEVRVRLAAGGGKTGGLAIEYVVGAARWWPAYTARFTAAATKVGLHLDALVAQASGEDWSRVRIALSTAHLLTDARLPELRSLRIGRAQPAPKRGYRPPPEGLDALFEGYDRAAGKGEAASMSVDATIEVEAAPEMEQLLAGVSIDMPASFGDELATRSAPKLEARAAAYNAPGAAPSAAGGFGAPQVMQRAALAMPAAAPMPARAKSAGMLARVVTASLDELAEEESAMPAPPEPPSLGIESGDAWLDFDRLVLADNADKSRRGRLVRSGGAAAEAEIESARRRIEDLPAPPRTRDPLAERGRFDHRYDAEGTADVPANGRPHRVAVGSAETSSIPCFTAVPRETAEVYREVEIKNPFDAPLLRGPVDIFLDGALMTTADLAFVDKAGTMRLGLGVEDRLRIARNARVDESSAGLLGGSLVVDHAVTIDLSSTLGHKVAVEVLERIPLTYEKDLDVKVTFMRPEAETYTQADRGPALHRGFRFTIGVPPGDKAKIEFGYRVTLPAKNEIVGGNRRE
ncbi:Hypothetical protein A7982_09977 [Minicystis rosea]|nr:Hypothetical protein A7982_09977 [Minicystis rosea]